MERKKTRIYPTDSLIHQFHARISAFCYLQSKKDGIPRNGWHNIRLLNAYDRYCMIEVRAIEVKEDKTITKGIFAGMRYIKWEVKPNKWHIQFLEYIKDDGIYAYGKNLLVCTPSFW